MDSDKPRGRDLDSLGQNIGAKPNAFERSDTENPPPFEATGENFVELARSIAQIVSDVLGAKAAGEPLHETIDGTLKD
jgi:hypothetical protein